MALRTSSQQNGFSRTRRTLFSLAIGDAALLLFITYGSVFPSRIAVPEPGRAMAEDYYDYSAKSSPLEVPPESRPAAGQSVRKISARSMPLMASVQANL